MDTGQEVHFLKVDVEGWEEAVLLGNDWSINRPWIVLVEATLPLSAMESFQGWEPILLNAGYEFAFADGLNRFYVSKEREAELLASLKYPPNVFDMFVCHRQLAAITRAEKSEHANQQFESQLEAAISRSEKSEQQLEAVMGSTSWRITAPLRSVVYYIKMFCAGARRMRQWAGRLLHRFLNALKFNINKNQSVKRFIFLFLRPLLGLVRLVVRHGSNPQPPHGQYPVYPSEVKGLSSYAGSIYAALKRRTKMQSTGPT